MAKLTRTGLLILIALALYTGALYTATRTTDELGAMKMTMQQKVAQVTYTVLERIN